MPGKSHIIAFCAPLPRIAGICITGERSNPIKVYEATPAAHWSSNNSLTENNHALPFQPLVRKSDTLHSYLYSYQNIERIRWLLHMAGVSWSLYG